MTKDARLVYSSDPTQNQKCPKCKELVAACTCGPAIEFKANNFVAVLRIEKQSRGGKTVTVIDRLPKIEPFLKEFTTELKKKCGSGGTYRMDGVEGIIEIQGDKREMIRTVFVKRGFKIKGG
jgi:translation initiation factor 1